MPLYRRSIDFFAMPEKDEGSEQSGAAETKTETAVLPHERNPIPENPEEVPGWRMVRTVFGSKKVLRIAVMSRLCSSARRLLFFAACTRVARDRGCSLYPFRLPNMFARRKLKSCALSFA